MACLAMSDKERIAEKTETIRKLMEERDQLKAEIERLQPRWIPVSERLPEYTSQYLVWVGVNPIGMGMWMEQRTAIFNTVTKRFSVDQSCKNEIIGSVEKWMELPKPPKEGRADG